MAKIKRTTQGRRKIAIEKISSEEARNVCFSKRRYGVFTKATDLATLCGAQVAILVNSPAGTPYSFGSPRVNEILDRFLINNNTNPSSNSRSLILGLNNQCMEISQQIDCAKSIKSQLEAHYKDLVESNPICQLVDDVECLGLADLEKTYDLLLGLKNKLDVMVSEVMIGAVASSSTAITGANPSRLTNWFSYGANQAFCAENHDDGKFY